MDNGPGQWSIAGHHEPRRTAPPGQGARRVQLRHNNDARRRAACIAAGAFHSLALRSDGTVVGWGYNGYGQASPPSGLADVIAIAAGQLHSLALFGDLSPQNQLAALRALILARVASGHIAPEMEENLLAKVDAAIAALERGDPPGAKVVMNDLKALVNQVEAQTDKKIETATAAEIIAAANDVIAALGG